MTAFAVNPEALKEVVATALGGMARQVNLRLGEVEAVVSAKDYLAAATLLRDDATCKFEQLIDLCGVDYSEYGQGSYDGPRYCVVNHLLSVSLNQRLRLKVFALFTHKQIINSLQK